MDEIREAGGSSAETEFKSGHQLLPACKHEIQLWQYLPLRDFGKISETIFLTPKYVSGRDVLDSGCNEKISGPTPNNSNYATIILLYCTSALPGELPGVNYTSLASDAMCNFHVRLPGGNYTSLVAMCNFYLAPD